MDYKKKLEEILDKVNNDIIDLKESTKPIKPENSLGRLTRMDAIGQKSINDKALRNAELKKQRVLSALNRIETGDFGYCLECGDEISAKRLCVMPESTLCIDCME